VLRSLVNSGEPRFAAERTWRLHPNLPKLRVPGIDQPVRLRRRHRGRHDQNRRSLLRRESVSDGGRALRRRYSAWPWRQSAPAGKSRSDSCRSSRPRCRRHSRLRGDRSRLAESSFNVRPAEPVTFSTAPGGKPSRSAASRSLSVCSSRPNSVSPQFCDDGIQRVDHPVAYSSAACRTRTREHLTPVLCWRRPASFPPYPGPAQQKTDQTKPKRLFVWNKGLPQVADISLCVRPKAGASRTPCQPDPRRAVPRTGCCRPCRDTGKRSAPPAAVGGRLPEARPSGRAASWRAAPRSGS
jgi:hypothetical protein